jgi:hypothetical protein
MHMKPTAVFPKVAKDMYLEQMKWTVWYLVFVLVTQIVHLYSSYFAIDDDTTVKGILVFLFQSAKVYMIVIAIISVNGFLSYYVGQGVTRKEFWVGSMLAALGLTATITFSAVILTYLEYGILEMFQLSHLLSDEFLNGNAWLVIQYLLNIFFYYLAGYLIGVGFYRFHWIAGIGFVALFLLSVSALEWSEKYSLGLNVLSSAVAIVLFLTLLRQLTKNIPVKL